MRVGAFCHQAAVEEKSNEPNAALERQAKAARNALVSIVIRRKPILKFDQPLSLYGQLQAAQLSKPTSPTPQ